MNKNDTTKQNTAIPGPFAISPTRGFDVSIAGSLVSASWAGHWVVDIIDPASKTKMGDLY